MGGAGNPNPDDELRCMLLYLWVRFNGEMRRYHKRAHARSTEFVYVAWQTQHLLDWLPVEDALDLGQLSPRQVLV